MNDKKLSIDSISLKLDEIMQYAETIEKLSRPLPPMETSQ